jgi:hypothetical protein
MAKFDEGSVEKAAITICPDPKLITEPKSSHIQISSLLALKDGCHYHR